jgi:MFS family permease
VVSSRLLRLVRVRTMGRRAGLSDRAIVVGFAARFTDELAIGLVEVLSPTLRRVFGLSLASLALLFQILNWVALAVEPPAALLIDIRSRRTLMSAGGACVGIAVVLMGTAVGYGMLIAGFVVYGIGSGPLVGTGDVVLVEAFAIDPERAFGRATMIDTVGALLAPAVVALAGLAGLSWRVPLMAVGIGCVAYAGVIVTSDLPRPPGGAGTEGRARVLAQLRANVVQVLADPTARRWLLFLLCFEVFEAPRVLTYVWLHDHARMGQGLVAVYAVGEQVVSLATLALLDFWLRGHDADRVVPAACLGLLVLFPAWLGAPGIVGPILVGVPLTMCITTLWPIAKARSLASIPGRAGAITAIADLFTIIPITLVIGVLAEVTGLTAAMLLVGGPAAGLLLLIGSPSTSAG